MAPTAGYAIADIATLRGITADNRSDGYSLLVKSTPTGPAWYSFASANTSNQNIIPNDNPAAGRWVQVTATPIGSLQMYAAATAPGGWLICDGSAVSRATYAALFAAIGTSWGVGDGSTTFNLPDLRGRSPVAAGQGSGLTSRTVAQTGGAETHALSVEQMPAHNHLLRLTFNGVGSTPTVLPAGNGFTGEDAGAMRTAGGGQAHNNMQPFAVVNFIIKF
jgi:microcystin-dependent protein